MTLERSHGKRRLTAPRLRDVSAPQSAEHAPRRDTQRSYRAARRALLGAMHSAAAQLPAATPGDGSAPQNGAQLEQAAFAKRVLSLYRGTKRELDTDSPLACAAIARWASQTALAQLLELAAVRAGVDTKRGERLADRAQQAAARAGRASIEAQTLASALGTPKAAPDPHAGLSVFGDPEEGGDEP